MNHAQALPIPDAPHFSLLSTDPLTPRSSSHSHSHVTYEVNECPENDIDPAETERRMAHRPLLLLSRSRGTQTETWPGLLPPSPLPLPSQLSSISPHEPRSESSSFSDSLTSHISIILERVLALLNRMSQADPLTLTNRLKRQNLKGADVGHLSRSTVDHILSEATGLRAQFRSLLEDDKVVLACTRKDMRLLFKFIKDVFAEMSQMRVTLNDVILDPSAANRVSQLALNPGKADTQAKDREISAHTGAAGWMAPISKLFTPAVRTDTAPVDCHATLAPSTNTRRTSRPPRFIPKLGPALAASATTVNVEFSGTGRSVTNTFSSRPFTQTNPRLGTASGVMDIFAGAPRSHVESDPWIVVPSGQPLRKSHSFKKIKSMSTQTIGCINANRFSHNVDVDRSQDADEESDTVAPLFKRTLRRRGLSDPSIHSTFSNQADATSAHAPVSSVWPDRSSVFQALSRTVQSIRATAVGTMVPSNGPLGVGVEDETPCRPKSAIFTIAPSVDFAAKGDPLPRPQTPPTTTKIVQPKPIRISRSNDGGRNALPPSGWMNPNNGPMSPSSSDPFVVSSLRDESMGRVRDRARDFF